MSFGIFAKLAHCTRLQALDKVYRILYNSTMRRERTERTTDRKSGVTIATRIPLDAYWTISDILAGQGSNVTQWLRGLALDWYATHKPQELETLDQQIERRMQEDAASIR
jgi:hypothetical protein